MALFELRVYSTNHNPDYKNLPHYILGQHKPRPYKYNVHKVLYNATIDKGGRLKKVCEELGWSVHEEDDEYYLSKYSPAGEDFGFSISKDNPYEEVQEYSDNFDPDEHCIMWIKEMNTVSGVPQSVRELIRDAEAIAGMLNELATYLNNKK